MKAKHSGSNYSMEIIREFGRFPITVHQNEYWVLVAEVSISRLSLDPENPRLWTQDVNGSLTKAGQKRLQETLTTGKMASSAAKLRRSMEYHGGQTDVLWVHKGVVKEGNRRLAQARTLNWSSVIVYIFPDEMPEDAVSDMLSQRHVAGLEQWSSAVRSQMAYSFLVERKMPMKDIVSLLQFKNEDEAEKYITAFVMWQKSGLPKEQWSKFHHACTPMLKKLFGYDKDHWKDNSEPFKESLRGKFYEDQPDLEYIDNAVAKAAFDGGMIAKADVPKFKADFNWFVRLIDTGRVTDCRQSDGIVSPAIKNSDAHYGPEVLRLLHSKPRKVVGESEVHEDGVGRQNPDVPAQKAWTYMKAARHENRFSDCLDDMNNKFESILGSAKRIGNFRSGSTENTLVRAKAGVLSALVSKFLQEVKEDQLAVGG